MGDIFRGIFLWIYWISALTFVGWNVIQQNYMEAILYFFGAIIIHLIVFGLIWRRKRSRERGEASFFDFLDCDGLDCDCDGGGGFGGDGGGFGGGD
jgi:hypothetical protein